MPIKILCCYAHKDQGFLSDLKSHLRSSIRQNNITIWNDTDISAGMEWREEIKKYLDNADIILLLISVNFMDSEYCCDVELKRAIERHDRGEARVIPILLRPVHWKVPPLDKLQVLPTDAKPITEWANQDNAFLNITENIIKVLKELGGADKETQQIRASAEKLHPIENHNDPENLYEKQMVLEKELKATSLKIDDLRLVLQLCYSIRQTCRDVILTFKNLTHEYPYQDIPDIRVLLFFVYPHRQCLALQCYIDNNGYFVNCKHRFTLDASKQEKLALAAQAWNSQRVESFSYQHDATEDWESFLRESSNYGFDRDQIEHTKARIASSVAFPFRTYKLPFSGREHPIVVCIDSTRKGVFPKQVHSTLHDLISNLISDFNISRRSPLECNSKDFANDNGGIINQCNP